MSSKKNNYITINDVYTTAGLPSLEEFNKLVEFINQKIKIWVLYIIK